MAFTGFINEFSNSPIQPTYQSYLALDFTSVTSVQLEWPFVNPSTETPYAQTIQVTVNATATNRIILPDATQATQGQTNTIVNSGASTILVYKFGGTTLSATIAPSQQWLVTLTDNTTSAGEWLPLQLGATTSAATAAELIDTTPDTNGHINSGGLSAFPTNYIKQNLFINKVLVGSTYTQASGDRGMILVWESGTGTYTCQSAAIIGNGYSFTVINNSTVGGQLTIAPASGDTINGGTIPFVLNPGNSSSFSSDGSNTIYSFASSQSQTDIVTIVNINLSTAVSNSITLSSEEAAYSIQKYIGNPSASLITVIYPDNIINEWIAYNASTTNPISVYLSGSPSFAYLIPPSGRLSLFSDGTNLYNTPNFLNDTTIYLEDGSVTEPSLTFSNNNSTGLFRQTSGTYTGDLGLTQNGTATFYAGSTLNTSIAPLAIADGSTTTPSLRFTSASTSGLYQTTSGAYSGAVTIGQNSEDVMYFLASGNTIVNASTIAGPALNTLLGSYRDQGISIYSLMRAYG
jgi:hypothetical protein